MICNVIFYNWIFTCTGCYYMNYENIQDTQKTILKSMYSSRLDYSNIIKFKIKELIGQ